MRSAAQRKDDTLNRLGTDANVWIATGSTEGRPHLVPLSLAWDGQRLLVATPADTPTARNATTTQTFRAALDSADDVVLIDGTVDVVDFAHADGHLVDSYVQRVGWNPANESGDWSLLIATPLTVRAWNSVEEISGRTIMRDGEWTT